MIDETDRILLTALADDARQGYAELGKRVHLSAPAVHARVKKLESQGVIQGYTIKIDPAAVGKPVTAFIRLMANSVSCSTTAAGLKKFPEIEECHSVAGDDCVLIKVRTATPAALEDLLARIRTVPGFERTVTTIVLRSHFERPIAPVAD